MMFMAMQKLLFSYKFTTTIKNQKNTPKNK